MKEKLFRSRKNRVLGGVAAGIAEYINIDVIVIRILMIVLSIFNGIGVLIYIILWIVLPEEPLVFTTASSANSGTFSPGNEGKETSSEAKREEPNYSSEDYAKEQKIHEELNKKKKSSGTVIGIILIVIGAAFTLHNFFYYFDFEYILPLAFIALGILLIFTSKNKIQENLK